MNNRTYYILQLYEINNKDNFMINYGFVILHVISVVCTLGWHKKPIDHHVSTIKKCHNIFHFSCTNLKHKN